MDKKYSSNNLGKTLLVLGGVGLISLIIGGCNGKSTKYSSKQEPIKKTQELKYEFTRFGIVCGSEDPGISQIEMVDVDGDGDEDMIIGRRSGSVEIYENKMQINKLRKSLSKHLNAQD